MLNTSKRLSHGAVVLLALTAALLQAPLKGDVSPIFATGLTLASCFVLWLPGFALAVALRSESSIETVCTFVTGTGVAGALLFIGWFIGRPVGIALEVLIAAGSIAIIASSPLPVKALQRPAFLAIVASVLYIAIAADHGGMIHGNARVAYRYWDGPDNIIPQLFTDAIVKGRQYLTPTLPGMGNWQSSDRPPLLTGMMLSAYPFVADTQIRRSQSTSVGIAALFGVLGLLLLFRRRREVWFSPLLKVIVTSTLAYSLIEFGGTYWAIAWLHTAPYSLLLIWIALGPLLVSKSPALSRVMLAATASAFVWIWIISAGRLSYHGTGMGHTDGAMTAVQVICILALVSKAIIWSKRDVAHEHQSKVKYQTDTRAA